MSRTSQRGPVSWDEGTWLHRPAAVVQEGGSLHVTAQQGSDAWRHTSYGFVHDSAHALLRPFLADTAMEVGFRLTYDQQFDQAGLYLHRAAEDWIKAGVEVSDGVPQVGAVVTRPFSDWSVAPVPDWQGREVTLRFSRTGDAVTVRARADDEPFRLVRVVPLDPAAEVLAGPYCCAPTRDGLTVVFTGWSVLDADASLHP